jgi:SAM-dependent methyltransferase
LITDIVGDILKLCFDRSYYDEQYFADPKGKEFIRPDGSIDTFGYRNPQAEWLGCAPIVSAWKTIFHPQKMLDVACGRGTFLTYARDVGIDAIGFDSSDFAVSCPYFRCRKEWILKHDATETYPYPDNSFDFVTVMDFMEHVYIDDIDKVLKEVYRVCGRYAFFLIATIGAGSGVNSEHHEIGYIIKKEGLVPIELASMVAAGHCTVCTREWWEDKLMKFDNNINWHIRRDLEEQFRRFVPADVLSTWKTIIILEKGDK